MIKSCNKFFNTVKLAAVLTWNTEAKIFAVILAVLDVIAILLGWYDSQNLYGKMALNIVCVAFIILVIIAIYLLIRNCVFVKCGGSPQRIGRHTVELREGGYEENMKKIIDGKKGHCNSCTDLSSYNFVTGMDRTGILDKSTTTGVIYAVFDKVLPDGCMQEVQAEIDKKRTELIGKDGLLPYGTCITVPVHLESEDKQFSMTFIANSEHVNPDADRENDPVAFNTITTNCDKSMIIRELFLFLKEQHHEHIVIGAIGTKELEFTYQEAISLILTNFYVLLSNTSIERHLIISVRESDYAKWNLTISDLQQFIIATAKFYNQKLYGE